MVEENFIETIKNSIQDNWYREAFTDYNTKKTVTYEDVAVHIAQIHLLLESFGIKSGDRISLIGQNNSNWVTVYLAVITYGAIIVPILQDFTPNDIVHVINHSESKVLFSSPVTYENLDISQLEFVDVVVSLSDMTILEVSSSYSSRNVRMSLDIDKVFKSKYPGGLSFQDINYVARDNKEIASINYTSGTTGFSKGVVISLNALAGNVKFCRHAGVIFPGSRQVVFLPLAHSFGCAFDFLTTFCAGGHAYFIGRIPSPKILLQAFQEIKPTCVFSVPLIMEKIYKNKIQPILDKSAISWVMKVPFLNDVLLLKIRKVLISAFGGEFSEIILGGAPLNQEVDQFLKRIKFPYTVGYGMTECAPLISYVDWRDYKVGSCGKLLEGLMEARIVNKNASGIGEIEVRGEHLMDGYYKNEEATNEVFTSDGWLKTGDNGFIDEDGFLFIKGRSKTMLLGPNGQNIYPEEIESKLNNMPYVIESLVIQQDGHLVALVCPDYEQTDANKLSQEMIKKAMEENRKNLNAILASYEKISRIILFPHEFEKTPKKSIKRYLYTTFHNNN